MIQKTLAPQFFRTYEIVVKNISMNRPVNTDRDQKYQNLLQ